MFQSDVSQLGYDGTFELNEFNQAKLNSEIELVKNVLLYVLFSKPGQYPSMPDIGLDIQSQLYSFYDEIDVGELRNQIIDQCNALGAYFSEGSINILKTKYRNQPSLMINITGSVSYPQGYMSDSLSNDNEYLIGITVDDMNRMLYNISGRS